VAGSSRHGAFLAEIRAEFPRFAIVHKKDSALQKVIGRLLAVVTLGAQRHYMAHYHTAMFGKLYVPESWDGMTDDDRYVLLRHERVHLRQRERMGDVVMALVYVFPIFPLGLAWGRARIEWEAYEETIRATWELHGERAAEALRPEIKRRYVGGDYGWMWPFPRTIDRWFDAVMETLSREARQTRQTRQTRQAGRGDCR
jgi:hypothetical protein